jgi:CubicO group peptidase (beta-lactamase class C family)
MGSVRTSGICAGLAGLALAAQSPAADTQAELDAIRAGREGIELAGIVVATIDRRGRLRALASGCARFTADGRDCAAPLRPDGLMRIASISKMVTAAETLHLVRRGLLSLDQDVSSLVGFSVRNPAFPEETITVRQLLNHTSSIVDGEQYWLPWPAVIDAATSGTHRFDADHGPGSFFRYCNFNYVLLGQILERAGGERFDRLVQRDQFNPQSLVAGFNWRIEQPFDPGRVVTLYRRQADGQPWNPAGPWIAQVDDFGGAPPPVPAGLAAYRLGSNGSVFSPHGGLRISLPDLARWLSRLDRATFAAMRATPMLLRADGSNGDSEDGFYRDFALGIHSAVLPGVGVVWGHFGEAYGLRAALLRDPASRRVWAYAITGYGDDPDRQPGTAAGLDNEQRALLNLLGRGITGRFRP